MSEWIGVKDRMPEDLVCVLVVTHGGDVDMVQRDSAFNEFMSMTSGDYQDPVYGVSHWMPLPAPPES